MYYEIILYSTCCNLPNVFSSSFLSFFKKFTCAIFFTRTKNNAAKILTYKLIMLVSIHKYVIPVYFKRTITISRYFKGGKK